MQTRKQLYIVIALAILIIVGVVGLVSTPTPVVEVEEANIVVTEPMNGDTVESPLYVSGDARGYWFFEGDAPLIMTDWDGRIIGESYMTAQGEWMTEDYVPFTGVIEFEEQEPGSRGSLIFQKDNPTGLPKHDDAVELEIFF